MVRIALLTGVLLCLLSHSTHAATIAVAKSEQPGLVVTVTGSITVLEPTECYIESADRSAGVLVQADTTGFAIGDLVDATGILGTVDGEPVIQNAALTATGGACPVASFAMRGNWVGGANRSGLASLQDWITYRIPGDGLGREWRVTPGLSNTGLLVTTWGTVRAVCYSPTTNARWFRIDDGSGVVCDYGDSGIIVYSNADVSEGDFVTVTGASSIETALDDPTRLVRVIRPVSENTTQPFNDEFDRDALDPRWSIVGSPDSVSLTANPGWLTLNAAESVLAICQQAPEAWDMEIRFRVDVPPPGASFRLQLISRPDQEQSVALATVEPYLDGPGGVVSLSGYHSHFSAITTFWVRARVTPSSACALVSTDGVSYTTGQPLAWGLTTATTTYPYLQLRAEGGQGTFSPTIDYIRFVQVHR